MSAPAHTHRFLYFTPSGRPVCEDCGFEQEPSIALDDAAIADMTEDAINAIALIVQTKIGQTDGGIGGVFFSEDEQRGAVEAIIRAYLKVEEAAGAA
jgi:hypothetical protein